MSNPVPSATSDLIDRFVYSFDLLEMVIKFLMTDPKGNSEFCFPETVNVPRGGTIDFKNMLGYLSSNTFPLALLSGRQSLLGSVKIRDQSSSREMEATFCTI